MDYSQNLSGSPATQAVRKRGMHLKLAQILFIVILVQGCSGSTTLSSKPKNPTLDEIRQTLAEDSQPHNKDAAEELPDFVSNALLPKYDLTIPKAKPAVAERFDINVNSMSARVFFMSLVRDTPINLIVHPDVKGTISLDLKSVTVDEVLEVARDVYGYEYQKNRAGYFILPARLQSRIFNVSYLNVNRKGESNTRITSGQLAISEQSDSSSGSSRSSSNSRRSSGSRTTRAFASSKIATATKADLWSDLEDTIKTIIGGKEGRSVVVSPQSGLVIVRAMPGELRDVENFLRNAEINLNRQVIIEAKVIEVQLNKNFQAGVNWGKIEREAARTSGAGQFLFNGVSSSLLDAAGEFSPAGIVTGVAEKNANNILTLGTATDDFAYILTLLDSQGDVNVLSSPRVSTVNNQKAVIKVGSDEFFVTELSSTTTTGTATTTTPEVTLTPFFSGIALDVTPNINEKDEVILHIHPTISEVIDQQKEITIGGTAQILPLAFSTVRESDSIIRAKSGQVIIIGGLMQNQTSEMTGGVPGLKSIPFLGRLFKQESNTSIRSELVILLKPTVIENEGGDWSTELQKLSSRIDRLK